MFTLTANADGVLSAAFSNDLANPALPQQVVANINASTKQACTGDIIFIFFLQEYNDVVVPAYQALTSAWYSGCLSVGIIDDNGGTDALFKWHLINFKKIEVAA